MAALGVTGQASTDRMSAAWPTAVLIDRKGVVRYRHIGEGAYDETESLIRRLLAEKE